MNRGKMRLAASGACLLSIVLPLNFAKSVSITGAHYRSDIVACSLEQHGLSTADDVLREDVTPLIDWIVAKTGWTGREAPPIRLIPLPELAKKCGAKASDLHLEALYSEPDHVIYLADGWRASDLRDRSVLLHELVHHLQFLNHMKVTCESEYEFQAYKLQSMWLGEHGVEHPLDFLDIDPLFILMLGQCE